ncbi:hypothetical protein GCM10027073_51450 [Streptomyces chlorus]
MVTGLLRPDQGTVEVVGHDVRRDPVEVKARIGVLPEGLLWPAGTAYGAALTLLGLRLAAPSTAHRLPEILTAVSKG